MEESKRTMTDFFDDLVIFQQNIGILGMQGSGKTTEVKNILDSLPDVPRLIISPQKPTINYTGYGIPITTLTEITDGSAMIWNGNYSKFTIERVFNVLMARISNMLIIIDDVHEFCTKQKMPPEFSRFILSGRNRGLCSIFISPIPQRAHNDILSSCTHMISYKMRLHNQIQWMKENFFGDDAELLLKKSLRDPRAHITVTTQDYDSMPDYSFLYGSDSGDNKLILGNNES